jgi:uncharacterized damage-inducible protein DinB
MSFADLSQHTAVLSRTPATLRALLSGLPAALTEADEGPGTWSPRVILRHLVEEERVNWIPRALFLLENGRARPFPPIDRSGLAEGDGDATLEARLDAFAELRAANLGRLAALRLSEDDLAMEGEHPTFGRVTLSQLLSTWVAHDLSHVAQIARVMTKHHRDAVGPWRAFLPIMDR